MHRQMREDLEKLLTGEAGPTSRHPDECPECRDDLAAMKEQAAWMRGLRAPHADVPLKAGFYARVMERIETQSPSIWNLFFDSTLGRALAMASMAIVLCLGIYLVSSESSEQQFEPAAQVQIGTRPAAMLA